jgi:hypothetical protein
MFQPPTDSFTATRPNAEVFAPAGGWNEKIDPKSPWQTPPPSRPSYQDDEALKQSFGIELAKAKTAFDAACILAGEDTSKALWISINWINDPVAIASRDLYLKTVELNSPPLDREQLAAKVLSLAEEKILSPKLGVMVPTVEPKDRIAALKLYSEILGYTGKVEIDNSIKNITNNELTIKLVKPDAKDVARVIDHAPNVKSTMANEVPALPINLKLVSGISR